MEEDGSYLPKRRLYKVGAHRTMKTHLARTMETQTPAHQVPVILSVDNVLPNPTNLGISSHCGMPAVQKESHPRTHPQLLPKVLGGQTASLASQPGA